MSEAIWSTINKRCQTARRKWKRRQEVIEGGDGG